MNLPNNTYESLYEFFTNKIGVDNMTANKMIYDLNVKSEIKDRAARELALKSLDNNTTASKFTAKKIIPAFDEPLKVVSKKPEAKLITKFKNFIHRKKDAIMVGAVSLVMGVTTFASLGSIVNRQTGSEAFNEVGTTITQRVDVLINDYEAKNNAEEKNISNLDTSNWDISTSGVKISDNAYDAAMGNASLNPSIYHTNRVQGIYDTEQHKPLNVTEENLQNEDFLRQTLQDKDNAVYFGEGEVNSLNNVDSFVNAGDMLNLMNHGGKVR